MVYVAETGESEKAMTAYNYFAQQVLHYISFYNIGAILTTRRITSQEIQVVSKLKLSELDKASTTWRKFPGLVAGLRWRKLKMEDCPIKGEIELYNSIAKSASSNSAILISNVESWLDIFGTSKVVLSASFSSHEKHHKLTIEFADNKFRQTFEHDFNSSISIVDILGHATDLSVLDDVADSICMHQPTTAYVTLYRSNGLPLAAHVSILPIGNYEAHSETKWAVATIRSAAVVGFSKEFGLGFYGLASVSDEAKAALVRRLLEINDNKQSTKREHHSSKPKQAKRKKVA